MPDGSHCFTTYIRLIHCKCVDEPTLPENRFSGLHFCCSELPNLTEVVNISEKGTLRGCKSYTVIEFGTNQTGIYDFLLVTNSNVGCMSHAFRVTVM